MGRSGLFALFLIPAFAAPSSAMIMHRALPTQQPEPPPHRPVGDPDVPPIGIDFFFEIEGGHEEAWPWPPLPLPTEN